MSKSYALLRCPTCRGVDDAGEFQVHPLRRGETGWTCAGCSAHYPLKDGIPIVVAEPERILSQPAPQGDVAQWCRELETTPPEDPAAREAWLLTMYALSHHSDACPSPFVRESMRDQGLLTDHLRGWLNTHGPVGGDAIELGCGVAGHAALWREACAGSVTLCDLRPAMLDLGRALNSGAPRTLPWRHMGRHYTPITVAPSAQPLEDVHYIVGDALNPPFPAEHFGLVTALNLLDAIRDPWMLLGQLDALTRPGGLLLLGQPFHYEAHAQHPDGWFSTPEALHGALQGGLSGLEHLNYELLETAESIPWSLPAHDRLVHRYAMHLVLAKKRG